MRKTKTIPEGHPRRMSDAKNAWRKMTERQRADFIDWIDPYDLSPMVQNAVRKLESCLDPDACCQVCGAVPAQEIPGHGVTHLFCKRHAAAAVHAGDLVNL